MVVHGRFALNTQVKRDVIYNIRPKVWYNGERNFKSKEEFIKAIYETLIEYKDKKFAKKWLEDFKNSYKDYYSEEIDI